MMKDNLIGKVILITGGSGGLGSYLAVELAKYGALLAIGYNKGKSNAQKIISSINSKHESSIIVHVDITNKMSVHEMTEHVINKFGKIDILINCAGISKNSMSWKTTCEDWISTIETNLSGSFFCIQTVLPYMKKNNWGRIINMSSIVGQLGIIGTSAYSASKAGPNGLSRTIAIETAKYGITVNSIALGYFETGMISNVPINQIDEIIMTIPMKRLGKLSELLHTVIFLCANEAEYITGQTINLNGGLYLS